MFLISQVCGFVEIFSTGIFSDTVNVTSNLHGGTPSH